MKTLKTIFAVVLTTTFLFTGCKKDKDEVEPDNNKNNYTYLDVTTKITSGKSLVATVVGVNTLSVVLTGEGTSKWIQLYFYIMGTIPTGSFVYLPNIDPRYNPTLHFTGGTINLDIASAHDLTSGTLNISKDGDNYTISLDGKTSRGSVKATYVGKITPQ
ncbi:MAG: hypothetical protein EOP00_13510 [Pedobacter sp.]|nr:MAG: hypothetical protein EOP00_13510 [Pedobacter sp.]